MFWRKKKKEQLKKQEYRDRLMRTSLQEETTKINMDDFNINKTKIDLAYDRYSSLTTKDLEYKLENDVLTSTERNVIKKILDDREY